MNRKLDDVINNRINTNVYIRENFSFYIKMW